MTKLLLWLLGLFGYRKEEAAVAAYQAEGQKEEAAAVEEKAHEIQEIQARVQAREDRDHEKVAAAADPDAAATEQLRRDGIITAKGENEPGGGG
jgi:hypothetical protein